MADTSICVSCGKPMPEGEAGDRCVSCSNTVDVQGIDLSVPPPDMFDAGAEELALGIPQLELLEPIGKGGMGVVYKARQKGLDRIVALKVLPPESQHDGSYGERFMREARALARLNHPNIVTVHDFGHVDDRWYFIMEYVDGVNLRQALRAHSLTAERACEIVPAICDALQYAHDEGIVHRDIKPENILLDKRGRVKIADFGLAQLHGDVQQTFRLTGTGDVMGTLHYMAPEQVERPREVDHRADIYAVGVMFYEMLTGELPLGRFRLPSEKAHTDPQLDDVVLKALEKEPDRRYQSASDVKIDIERISSSGAISPTPLPPPRERRVSTRKTPPPLPRKSDPAGVTEHTNMAPPVAFAEPVSEPAITLQPVSGKVVERPDGNDMEKKLQELRRTVEVGCYVFVSVAAVLFVVGVSTGILDIMLPMVIGFGAVGVGGIRVNRAAFEEYLQVARGETPAAHHRDILIHRRRLRAGLLLLVGGAVSIPIVGVTGGGIVMIIGGILGSQGAVYTGIRAWMRHQVNS